MGKKTQNNVVTLSKALAMILVVIGHAGVMTEFNNFVVFFHVPIFFFLSGYCFKEKYLSQPGEFIKRRILGLWKPFVIVSVVFVLLHNVLCKIGLYDTNTIPVYTYTDIVKKIFLAIFVMSNTESLVGAIWFLRSLLVGAILGYALFKLFKTGLRALIISFILLVLSSVLFVYFPNLKWIENFLYASTIYLFGYVYKNNFLFGGRYWIIPIALCIIALGSVLSPCELKAFTPYNLLWLIVCSLLGIIMLLKICVLIEKYSPKILSGYLYFIGEHTLSILIGHFIAFKLVSLLLIWFNGMPIEMIGAFPTIEDNGYGINWILYTFVGINIPLIYVCMTDIIKKRGV